MNIFTQLVYVVGRVTPNQVDMLGTAFLVSQDGLIATTHHVAGSADSNLVVLAPHIKNINAFQDLSDTSCTTIPVSINEIDPIRDLAILKGAITFDAPLPKLGSFDDDNVGEEIGIFGFPHCVEGRRALTFQKAEVGAKEVEAQVAGRKGFVAFDKIFGYGGTGHVDLFDGTQLSDANEWYPSRSIKLWFIV